MSDTFSETDRSSETPPRWHDASLKRILIILALLIAVIMFLPLSLLIAIVIGVPALFFKSWPKRIFTGIALLALFIVAAKIYLQPMAQTARIARAKMSLSLIVTALERYRTDFRDYPPDSFAVSNGAEVLHQYLCRRMQVGEFHYGPYIENVPVSDLDGNGISELNTVWGRDYIYVALADGTRLVIDRGPDSLLGGTVSHEKGFVPDASDANHDGVTDDKDNIYATPVVPTGGGL